MSSSNQSQKQLKTKRSKTPIKPRKEAQNSKQRRRSKTPRKGEPRHALNMTHMRRVVDKIDTAHARARDLKLDVWDHKKTVVENGKSRFQTLAEWRAQKPKPSLLSQALKDVKESHCDHKWVDAKLTFKHIGAGQVTVSKRVCSVCDLLFESLKDEKVADSYQALYDAACEEFEAARETMRAGLKERPIRMRMATNFKITTTVTTGVTNTVNINGTGSNSLDPSQCTEWSVITALFDEYKCLGGECEFIYNNNVPSSGSLTGSNNIPVIAYDPDNGGSASSSIYLFIHAQHKALNPIGAIGSALYFPAEGGLHKYKWHTTSGDVFGGTVGALPGKEWILVQGVSPAGSLLFYHVGSVITATDTGVGVILFDFEFRCRT